MNSIEATLLIDTLENVAIEALSPIHTPHPWASGLLGYDIISFLNNNAAGKGAYLQSNDEFYSITWIDLDVIPQGSLRGAGIAWWGDIKSATGYVPEAFFCELIKDIDDGKITRCFLSFGSGDRRYDIDCLPRPPGNGNHYFDEKSPLRWTPLMQAVRCGDNLRVSILLGEMVDVDYMTASGMTALSLAVLFNHCIVAERLLAIGANPNISVGRFPLLCLSTMLGYADMTGLLLSYGANVSLEDGDGQTAEDWAEFGVRSIASRTGREYKKILHILKGWKADKSD